MMTSRFRPLVLVISSSSLPLAAGFSTDLPVSKNASAAKVSFSLTGTGGATGTTGGAGGGTTAGAGTGAGGGAGGGLTMAPSQSVLAVPGVQGVSRQQCWLVPFFQTLPELSTQLSLWAKAPDTETARTADAKSDATLLSFFMFLLSRKGAGFSAKCPNWNRKLLANSRCFGRSPPTADCAIGCWPIRALGFRVEIVLADVVHERQRREAAGQLVPTSALQ
jgi:hypothetical protein